MFFPRFVILAIIIFCALVASNLYMGVWEIPLPALHVIVIIASGIFGISGMIMFVGSFGINMTESGPAISHENILGRSMTRIINWSTDRYTRSDEKPHCCDIYIATTKATVAGAIILFVAIGMLTLMIADFLGVLLFVACVVAVVATIFGIGWVIDWQATRYRKNHPPEFKSVLSHLERPEWKYNTEWIGFISIIVIVLSAIGYELIVSPILAIIALGYGVITAIAIYSVSVSMISFPLFCMVGKKLILRTREGAKLCPEVKM